MFLLAEAFGPIYMCHGDRLQTKVSERVIEYRAYGTQRIDTALTILCDAETYKEILDLISKKNRAPLDAPGIIMNDHPEVEPDHDQIH